jgi:lipopolysaccharide biosynthesis protein
MTSPPKTASDAAGQDVEVIAIHLPQFHPVPENSRWWGEGFTEWTNVTKARPLWPGHYQPHLPADLGFYDLRLPEARQAQADLAKAYGIAAFCYYHYWFTGQRILERPVEEIVLSGEPDLPFCLCWANENWTRTWTERDREILLEQTYSHEDDIAHIRTLIPILSDQRYLRMDGKPALFIYRADLLPDAAATARTWREEVRNAGLGELFLGAFVTRTVDLDAWGFDVAVEFVPCPFRPSPARAVRRIASAVFARVSARLRGTREAAIHLYDDLADDRIAAAPPPGASADRWLRCVTPGWDNSARRKRAPIIFLGASPEKYRRWLTRMIGWTRKNTPPGRRFVFVNAWNEWAEGNHLEPDRKHGHAFLEATRQSLEDGNRAEPAML